MRATFFAFQFAIALLFVMCGKVEEKFMFQPRYPVPGQQIGVTYHPTENTLENADNVTMLAYCYPEGMPFVEEVEMEKSGNRWKGAFQTADTALVVYIIFRSDEKLDDNYKEGYSITLYTSEHKPVKGAMARHARVVSDGGTYPLRLKRDFEKTMNYLEQEFGYYPEQKEERDLVMRYYNSASDFHSELAPQLMLAYLEKLERKDDKNLLDLSILAYWYKELDDQVKADKYEKQMQVRKQIEGMSEYERYAECARESSMEKKLRMIHSFEIDFPHSEYISRLHYSIVSGYMDDKLYQEALQYIDNYLPDPDPDLMNDLAWAMIRRDVLLDTAVSLAEKAVEKARVQQEIEVQPTYYTTREWRERQNRILSDYLDTYGLGLYKLGNIEESVVVYAEAVERNQHKSAAIRERYSRALYESGQIEKAYEVLRTVVWDDPSRRKTRAFYTEVYTQHTGSADGLESFFAEAEKNDRLRKEEEIRAQMINKEAPPFTLKDLDGKNVSLADYKGKIVVLDFWGTWCGPCLQSFPHMQQTVNKYSNDDQVKFLFIDFSEKIERPEKKVREIIDKNNYTFHVLLDQDDSVANAYKVTNAPYEIIIDPEGNIRFEIKGYGSESMDKLDMMIAMLR